MRRGSGVGGRGASGVALAFEVRSKSKSASSAVSGVAIVNSGEERNWAAFGSALQLTCVCWSFLGPSTANPKVGLLRMLDELVLKMSRSNLQGSLLIWLSGVLLLSSTL